MKELLDSIADQIVSGSSVAEAYEHASIEATKVVGSLIRSGQNAREALHRIGVVVPFDPDDRIHPNERVDKVLMHVVVAGGGVANVPKASCVAERLRGNPNPSLEDIKAAFDACAEEQ